MESRETTLDEIHGINLGFAEWDGTPNPYWRKRLGRHVRSCPVCRRAATRLLPTDRLPASLLLLPVRSPLAVG